MVKRGLNNNLKGSEFESGSRPTANHHYKRNLNHIAGGGSNVELFAKAISNFTIGQAPSTAQEEAEQIETFMCE